MTVLVFMYHAIYQGDVEYSEIPEEDRPYAISISEFKKQLNSLVDNEITVLNPCQYSNAFEAADKLDKQSVLLTFDDGHSSFYNYAFPELLERNMAAIFFVTSDLINERTDFCDWEQLKEMSGKGMSIQSHGKTHKFISDLEQYEAEEELLVSKKEIEYKLSNTVSLISFPGGRYTAREIEVGLKLGYEYFFTSDEGVNTKYNIKQYRMLKRFALRGSTTINEFVDLSKGDYLLIKKRILINAAKKVVKRMIGNSIYHFLYKRLRAS